MAKKIVPTDADWIGGRFEDVVENSSGNLELAPSGGGYVDEGRYTTGVVDIGQDQQNSDLSVSGTTGSGTSLDGLSAVSGTQHRVRVGSVPPAFVATRDEFGGYGSPNPALWFEHKNTNATYTQANGKLSVQIPNVAGNKLWLGFLPSLNVVRGSGNLVCCITRMQPQTIIEGTDAEIYAGLYTATKSDVLPRGASLNTQFSGIGVTGTTTEYRMWSRVTDYNGGDMSLPNDVWFLNGYGRPMYRPASSSQWTTVMSTSYVLQQGQYMFLVFEVVAASGSHGSGETAIDVDVDLFVLSPVDLSYTPSDWIPLVWNPGQSPGYNDPHWAPCAYGEDFFLYSSGLDIKPASAGSWEDWDEGLLQVSGDFEVDGRFQGQHRSYTSSIGPGVTMEVDTPYVRTSFDSSVATGTEVQHELWDVSRGYDSEIPAGSFEFDWYYYRSDVDWPSTGLELMRVEASNVTQAATPVETVIWAMRMIYNLGDTNYRWQYLDSTGTWTNVPTNNSQTLNFSGGNSYTHRLKVYWDEDQGKTWAYTARGASEWIHQGEMFFGINSGVNYGVDMRNVGAPNRIVVYHWHHKSTGDAASEHRIYYPALFPGVLAVFRSFQTSRCENYHTNQLLPWRWTDSSVSGDPAYFGSGRFVQTQVKLVGS